MSVFHSDLFRQQALIAGSWRDAADGTTLAVSNPSTGATLGQIPNMGRAEAQQAVDAAAERHQVPASQLHFEQFILEDKIGEAFTLVLARSGREFTVPQDMTILQVIENNKAAKVECLCREGVCGTCETMILEGEADHRDQYYSEEEKASQQSMLICCSRAKGGRLVLDL
ncbi:Phthalate dioxygenase reductase [Klebsiella pneumoniae]|nr:Phthalate dioxygenase reductase [Klebsiella pneumoniae]